MESQGAVVARVFWPQQLTQLDSPSYILGWNVRSFIACVACVVQTKDVADPADLKRALQMVASKDSLQEIHKYCSGPPILLGLWNSNGSEKEEQSGMTEFIEKTKETSNFWLAGSSNDSQTPNQWTKNTSLSDLSQSLPELATQKLELSCFGYQYAADFQIILYQLPTSKHYYSCFPLNMDSFAESVVLLNGKESELEKTLQHVNCSFIIEREIKEAILISKKTKGEVQDINIEGGGEEEEKVKMEDSDVDDVNQLQVLKRLYRKEKHSIGWCQALVWYMIMIVSFGSSCCHSLLDKMAGMLPTILSSRLEESATMQQIRIRLAFSRQLPWAWLQAHRKWENHPQSRKLTVNFKNMFSIIAIDIFLGIVFAILITQYVDDVVHVMNSVTYFFTETIIESNIKWLMGWPAGFKLNDNVDRFMGQLFLFYNVKWIEVLHAFPISYHSFVVLTCSTGCLGLSMMLSTISDVLFVCVLHITWFYTGSARVYMHQLQALSGLWKLFRGKKKNVLRNRIDSCHYDVDQLLLGTLLFSVLFFLLPTVAIYYCYFSLVRFLVFTVHASIFFALQLLNHFPIYSMFLYLYDSSLFAGGVFLKVLGHHECGDEFSNQCSSYFFLKSQSSSFGSIFYYFKQWVSDFFKNNSVGNIISCAILGRPIQFTIHSYKYL